MDHDVILIGQFVFEDIPNRTQIGTVGHHYFLPILDIGIIVLGLCHCQGKNETDEYDQTSTQVALYTGHACLLRTIDGYGWWKGATTPPVKPPLGMRRQH